MKTEREGKKMRKLSMILALVLMLVLSSCVFGGGEGEADMGNRPDTEASVETTTAPLPEIPNDGEDGYSKRY